MKVGILVFVISLLYLTPALSEASDHWNYVELSKLEIHFDNTGEDAKGFGINSKYSINENIFIGGIYQRYSIPASDNIERYFFGFGGKIAVSENLIPFTKLDYVYVDSGAVNTKYWLIEIGVSGYLSKFGYKVGLTKYEVISDEINIEDDTGVNAELFYSINKKLSTGLEIESVNDSGEVYNIAVRYHF